MKSQPKKLNPETEQLFMELKATKNEAEAAAVLTTYSPEVVAKALLDNDVFGGLYIRNTRMYKDCISFELFIGNYPVTRFISDPVTQMTDIIGILEPPSAPENGLNVYGGLMTALGLETPADLLMAIKAVGRADKVEYIAENYLPSGSLH